MIERIAENESKLMGISSGRLDFPTLIDYNFKISLLELQSRLPLCKIKLNRSKETLD